MDPPRMIVMEDARPLTRTCQTSGGSRTEDNTHVVTTSLNNQTPSTDPATPRTAEDTMWVIGEVTLMDNRLAMLIKKPKTP